ncbi:MAG: YidC/Oxa1 family insertase periplasmic-domain containing protein [Pirellulales bacterium]
MRKNDPAKKNVAADGKAPDAKAAENKAADPGKNADPTKPETEKPAVESEVEPARFTLGRAERFNRKDAQADKLDNKILITLNSRGATIERAELNGFPDLEDFLAFDPTRKEQQHDIVEKDANWNRSGYLGHLATSLSPEKGVRVNVVGPGTPADEAGLKVGDVLQELTYEEKTHLIADPVDFVKFLLQTKPDQELKLKVKRGDARLDLTATLGWPPAQVIRPEANNRPLLTVTETNHDPFSFGMRLSRIDDARIDPAKPIELDDAILEAKHWQGKQVDENTVEFVRELPARKLRVVKRFRLQTPSEKVNPTGYEVRVEVELSNTGDIEKKVAYELDGPNGLPIEGWWYAYKNRISTTWFTSLGIRDVAIRTEGNDASLISTIDLVNSKTDLPSIPLAQTPLTYAGVDCQYFSAVLIPRQNETPFLERVAPKIVGAKPPEGKDRAFYNKLVNVTSRVTCTPQDLKPGASVKHDYDLFIGPKRPSILNEIGSENTKLDRLVYFGWPIFSYPAHILLTILHFFHGIVPNYGLNIIMLTVFVRLCLFPLSRKQAMSAAMMTKLQPKIKAIKERYKDKREEVGRATQELFRQHSYNPFGGCLLAFVQLPIFMGLYRALMIDVELRGAPLFGESVRWCSNLGVARHADVLGAVSADVPRRDERLPRSVSQRAAADQRVVVLAAAKSVDAAGDRRANSDAAIGDEIHDGVHGLHVLHRGQRVVLVLHCF